jgi:hypothetical protein
MAWFFAAAARIDDIQENPPKPTRTSLRDSMNSNLAARTGRSFVA